MVQRALVIGYFILICLAYSKQSWSQLPILPDAAWISVFYIERLLVWSLKPKNWVIRYHLVRLVNTILFLIYAIQKLTNVRGREFLLDNISFMKMYIEFYYHVHISRWHKPALSVFPIPSWQTVSYVSAEGLRNKMLSPVKPLPVTTRTRSWTFPTKTLAINNLKTANPAVLGYLILLWIRTLLFYVLT